MFYVAGAHIFFVSPDAALKRKLLYTWRRGWRGFGWGEVNSGMGTPYMWYNIYTLYVSSPLWGDIAVDCGNLFYCKFDRL